MSRLSDALIPPSQRLSADELHDTLNLGAGEVGRKRSAFLIMLVLSAIIAAAGVLGDSTATVIGAMIIAPLATPILGIALGIVVGQLRLPCETGRGSRHSRRCPRSQRKAGQRS